MSQLRRFLTDESGATMVEYGIMVALIAAVSIIVIGSVGQKVLTAFTTTDTNMPN